MSLPMSAPADAPERPAPIVTHWRSLRHWFDTEAPLEVGAQARLDRIDWLRALPFIGLHLGLLAIPLVGISTVAVVVALALYAIRMFALTGFYHRYFSHRSFRTSRPVQFVFAVIGAACCQRGPLWWAAHHRNHHRHADTALDSHSPGRHGFLWSHMGWFLTARAFPTDLDRVRDLTRFAELRWLNRFDLVVPLCLALSLYGLGAWLHAVRPDWQTSGAQLLVWGFVVSTVALLHATFAINSLAHRFGSRRFATSDDSRNNLWLALLTFGEGWHNNHHRHPGSARQGFHWWEIDLTYYGLRVLAALRLVSDLRAIPPRQR